MTGQGSTLKDNSFWRLTSSRSRHGAVATEEQDSRVPISGSSIEQAIQVFAAIAFLVIGLSHLAQPKAWIVFYQTLASWGTTGVFVEGFLLVNFGAIIVAFHNVWHGPAMVLTLIGWSQVFKGLGRFLAPQLVLKGMQRATLNKAWYFQAGGVFALALSGFLWWLRFRS